MAEIIKFYPANAGENPDNVLEQAVGVYDDVLIIGYNKEGGLEVRANTTLDHQGILWLIEIFKQRLFSGEYSEVE